MTKLQFLCLAALEDMTLKQLNKKYFDDGGIGYTKKVIAGKAKPVDFIMEGYSKRFPKKYQKLWDAEFKRRNTFQGW